MNSLTSNLTALLANDSYDAASKIDALMVAMFAVAVDTIKKQIRERARVCHDVPAQYV